MTQVANKIISPVNIEKRQEIDIRSGDTVRVAIKIPEGEDKVRLQNFEGIVLARKHGTEAGATFTVRRVIDGVGVEQTFPLYSPVIDEIKIIRRAKTRRSKLYHIRDKAARQIRRQMRRMIQVDISTGSDIEEKAEAERKAKEEAEAEKEAEEKRKAEEAEKAEAEKKAAEAEEATEEEETEETESADEDASEEK